MKYPASLKYTKDHEWVKVEDNICIVGVTDYAQSELGDIIYLDISTSEGAEVKMGESIGSIEAVKTVSEVYTPVSGKITEINNSINDNPSVVNTDPYEGGWIVKIEYNNADEISNLLDPESYKELTGA